jgi:hypothetical protein
MIGYEVFRTRRRAESERLDDERLRDAMTR